MARTGDVLEYPATGNRLVFRPPLAVQRALLTPLAALGRLRGYRAWYPEYRA